MTGPVTWELVALLVTVVAGAAGGTWWLAGTLRRVGGKVESGVDRAVAAFELKLEKAIEAMKEHVTLKVGTLRTEIETSRMEQALRVAMLNPGFKVSDPRDPKKVISVRVEDLECDEGRGGGGGA